MASVSISTDPEGGHNKPHSTTAHSAGQAIRAQIDIAELTLVFDRGYRKYLFHRDLIRRGAHFVTRERVNNHFEPQQAVALDTAHPEIVSDHIGLLGGTSTPASSRMRLRRIVTRCERGEMVFLTTHLELSATEVCALYQQRWIVEIFFRWLNSNVNLERPLGYRSRGGDAHHLRRPSCLLSGIASGRLGAKYGGRACRAVLAFQPALLQKSLVFA